MTKLVRICVAAFFYYTGLVKLARWWMQHSGRSLIIVAYHRANEGDLRSHLLYLRRNYRILHLEEALEELYAPPYKRKKGMDQRTPLVLTFDDGYYDNYTHGFPLACELKIPMTIFLIPGYIENGEYFWWLESERLVHQAKVDKIELEDCIYYLNRAKERETLIEVINSHLRDASSVIEREEFLAIVRKKLDVHSTVAPKEEKARPLTWEEVHKMEESGWISFGGHTMHHPILGYLSNPEEVRREVSECRRVLEEQLGHRIRTFAYPVGKPEHIGKVALEVVHEACYGWAVTTTGGICTPKDNPLQLPRVMCEVNRPWLVTAAQISGVWYFFSPLWRWTKTLPWRKRRIAWRWMN